MGRNELLQRPAPAEPDTSCIQWRESQDLSVVGERIVNVPQVSVTDNREGIVMEHGIDGFRELSTARLVNAARVDPHPSVAMLLRKPAAPPDLVADDSTRVPAVLFAFLLDLPDVLERLLSFFVPDVRQSSVAIRDLLGGGEVVQLGAISAE